MVLPATMQGRPFGPLQLAEIRGLLHDHPDWSLYQLSRALARRWNWHGPNGHLKDMAARTLLGKLALRGWIQLPRLALGIPHPPVWNTRLPFRPAHRCCPFEERPVQRRTCCI